MMAQEIIMLQSGRSVEVRPINYADLAELRENGKLQPGRYYRIVDYTTTVANHQEARAAGHQFDILVKAASAYDFLATAYAIPHAEDTYYANCNLSEWKLKYCFDNDTKRFAWADAANGTGVVYSMKDTKGNKAPFDFTNIQFKRYAITNIESGTLTEDALANLKQSLVYSENGGKCFASKDVYGNFVPQESSGTTYTIDEETSVWYYVFNGFLSEDGETLGENYDLTVNPFKLSDECLEYLAEQESGTDTEDHCADNVIRALRLTYSYDDIYYTGAQSLNNIVFVGGVSYCLYNSENEEWSYAISYTFSNSFKSDCYNQTFGNNCSNQTFGNYCNYQTFGNYCANQTFGNDCANQTFGNYCNYQTFGNNCSNQTFGNGCAYQTFGNGCAYQTFGNDCANQTFGNNCYGQTFGNGCTNQTFGNNCYYQTFGNDCGVGYVFDGVKNTVVGDDIRNFQIYSADYEDGGNKRELAFVPNANYTQVAAFQTDGTLAIWNPAD